VTGNSGMTEGVNLNNSSTNKYLGYINKKQS